jgi:sterol desaturase/sphingolipid hydroxylase (fatty acid hydroxylase superfamily)
VTLDLIVGLSLPLFFIFFLAIEALGPGAQAFPRIRWWRSLGSLALVATLMVNAAVSPLLLSVLPRAGAVDLAWAGAWAVPPILLLTTFFTYWAHRIQHRYDLLWRMGHQLHHSVRRIDIASAMMFHPFDVAVQASMTTLAAWLLGGSPAAAAIAGVTGFVIALFQHWNLRTPRWVGWFVQRPEAHRLHHERDVHARNFGDLPLWDMVFGTYANPATVDVEVGFDAARSRRVLAMLLWRDVNRDADAGKGRM